MDEEEVADGMGVETTDVESPSDPIGQPPEVESTEGVSLPSTTASDPALAVPTTDSGYDPEAYRLNESDDAYYTMYSKEGAKALNEYQHAFKSFMEDEAKAPVEVETYEVIKRGFTDGSLVTALSNFKDDLVKRVVDPSYFDPDPDHKVTDEDLEGFTPDQQQILLSTENAAQLHEAKARAIRWNETQDMMSRTSWPVWIGAQGAQLAVEMAMTMGMGVASGGLNVGGKIAAKVWSGGIKNSRILGAAQAGTAGALGATAQGAFEYSQNVTSAQEAAMYPVMGLLFGGALGGVAPHLIGGVKRADMPGNIDPMAANLENAEIAVARVQQAMRDEGVKFVPGEAKVPNFEKGADELAMRAQQRKERPDLDPDEWTAGKDSDMENVMKGLVDDQDVDMAPPGRKVLLENDLVQRIRDPDVAEEATKMFDKDLDAMDSAFALSRPPSPTKRVTGGKEVTSGWNPNVEKTAKAAGEAMRRQGYRFEAPNGKSQKLYMVDHPHNHKVAQASGQGIRHAYSDPAVASKYAAEGARIVEIDVPTGSKVIEGGGLADQAGVKGEFMMGDGKPVLKADGRYEWRPNKEVKGNKQIISGRGPDGETLTPAEILYHNQIQAKRAKAGVGDVEANMPGAGVGANVIAKSMHDLDMSAQAKEFLANPDAGFKAQGMGPGVSRAGIALKDPNKVASTHAPDLISGGVKDLSKHNRDLDVYGTSAPDKIGRMNGNDNSAINQADDKWFKAWKKEMKQQGVSLPRWPGQRRAMFARMVSERRAWEHDNFHHAAWGHTPPNPPSQSAAIEGMSKFLDDFYAQKRKWAKDPGDSIGESGKYEGIGGSENMGDRKGYEPFYADLSMVKKLEQDGYEGVIHQTYTRLLEEQMQRAAGVARLTPQIQADAEMVARIYSNMLRERGGNTGFTTGHLRSATSSEQMVELGKSLGISQHNMDQLKQAMDRMMKNSDATFGNMLERLDVPLTKKVRVQHGQNPSMSVQVSLHDFMLKNPPAAAKTYGRTMNGWVGLATTARRNKDGVKMTHDIPQKDPQTGQIMKDAQGNPIMKTVPWTLRNQAEIDKLMRDIRTVDEELSINNAWMKNREIDAVYEESIDALLNRSKENPNEHIQGLMNLNLVRTMGRAGWSSLQELGMLARQGADGWAQLLSVKNLARDMGRAFGETFGTAKPTWAADSALAFIKNHNMGTATASVRGNLNDQFDNAALGLSGASTAGKLNKVATAHRMIQATTEGVLKYSGLLPLQDALQYRAGLAYLNKVANLAHKYKNFQGLPRRHVNRLQRMGMTSRDIDQIFNYLNSGAVRKKRNMFGRFEVDKMDSGVAGFDGAAHEKLGDSIYRTVTKNVIMEPKAGAKFPGMDNSVMSVFTQLQSFQMASMSQMMNNMGREALENFGDMGRSWKAGKFNAHDGMLDAVMGQAALGGTLLSALLGTWAVEIAKQEHANWDQSPERKAKMREQYTDGNWMGHVMLDKTGIFSFIPWTLDNIVSPYFNAESTMGFKDYDQKHDGLTGIAENFVLHNLTAGIPGDIEQSGNAILDMAGGNVDTKKAMHATKVFSNFWLAQDVLKLALKAGGVKQEDKTFVKPDYVGNLKKAAAKSWKKQIDKGSKATQYWFGDK